MALEYSSPFLEVCRVDRAWGQGLRSMISAAEGSNPLGREVFSLPEEPTASGVAGLVAHVHDQFCDKQHIHRAADRTRLQTILQRDVVERKSLKIQQG